MSIDSWLITSSDRLVSLKEDIAFLEHLLQIEDRIADFRSLEVEDAFDLLQVLVIGPTQEQTAALTAIGIDPKILSSLGKRFLKNLDEQEIEEFQLLLSNFAMLTTPGQEKPVEQVWPLFDQSRNGERLLKGGLQLRLNAAFGLRLTIQALADLPQNVAPDVHKSAVLRLSLSGQLTLGSELAIAGAGANLGVSAQASGSASVDYFYRHLPNRRVGDALLIDLRRLTSPFSISLLQQRLLQDNLAAIKLRIKHQTSLNGKVGFVQDLQISEWISGKAGITFDFSKSIAGDFDYLIQAGDDGNLVVEVKRLATSAEASTLSLGLSVDLTEWAGRVYPQICERLGALGDVVNEFEALLPGRGDFRSILGKSLAEALGGFDHKEEVLQGLGLIVGDQEPTALLEKILLDKLESSRRLWTGDARERADEIAAALVNDLPVSTDIRNKLSGQLNEALENGLGKLDKALDDRLRTLLKGANYKRFAGKLNMLGHQVDDTIGKVDDRIVKVKEPVKEELDNLQRQINKLKALFSDASKAKISMTLSALMREQKTDSLDLSLTINPNHADAQAVLDALVRADINTIFRRIVDPNGKLAPDSNGPIVSASGTSTRYASMLDERGFATVLFGYGLSGKTRITADAKLVVDAHGNIQALTKAEFKKQYKSFHDDRELQIIDVMELATASRTNSISLATNLSMTDEDLTPGEAMDFFRSAERAGLLAAGTAEKARVHLSSTNLKSGRLDVGMSLSKEQLLRLLAIDKPEAKLADQAAIDTETVFRVARRNMAEICTQQPPSRDLIERLAMLREQLPGFGVDLGDDLEGMIACMTRKRFTEADKWLENIHADQPHEILNSGNALSWARARYVAVNGCHGTCSAGESQPRTTLERLDEDRVAGDTQNEQSGLLDAIEGMRKVYFSHQLVQQMDVACLRQQQADIGMAFKTWFVWQGDFPRWWMLNTKEIRPLTLAFFRTLGELSQAPGEALPMLSAAITLKGPQGEDKKRIPLA